ncbi:hypothetical protein KKH27_01095 [bacterium]|nr:hypothetical protein [bacterium]MBU1983663.1 hypothetical protein [bacterium]
MRAISLSLLVIVFFLDSTKAQDSLNVRRIGWCDTPGGSWGVAVSGSYAYMADMGSGLRIIDISSPATPTEVGFYDTQGYAWDVAVSGNYAYVSDEAYGLRVLNIANPAAPTQVGFYDTPGYEPISK